MLIKQCCARGRPERLRIVGNFMEVEATARMYDMNKKFLNENCFSLSSWKKSYLLKLSGSFARRTTIWFKVMKLYAFITIQVNLQLFT